MIYVLVGTDVKVREKELQKYRKFGNVSAHIYSEHISSLESFVDASNLFGEKVIVYLNQVMDLAGGREELIRLLPQMKESSNIFIIDEPFADANKVKVLQKYAKELTDARLPKETDVDVFTLCNLFVRRDKKGVWEEWIKVRDLDSPEAFQGALWWKFSTLWKDSRSGRATKFSESEFEKIGGKLLRSVILAHSGKTDLKTEIEEVLLMI